MQKLAWLVYAAVALGTLSCGSEVRVVPSGDGGGGSAGVGGAGDGGDGGVATSSSANSGGAGGDPFLVSPVNSGMCVDSVALVGWLGTVAQKSVCDCFDYEDPPDPPCGHWHLGFRPMPGLGSEVLKMGLVDLSLQEWLINIGGYPPLGDGTCPFEIETNPEDWEFEIVDITESAIVLSIAATYPMSQIIDGVYTIEICASPERERR